MKVVILAGGRGTRLRPYTTAFPKPLMPIGQRPILDVIVQQLSCYGFKDIILSCGYLSELIEAYFMSANGRFRDVNFTYTREQKPTGTAGSLRDIKGLDETFMVMNGDVLTSMDYRKILEYHRANEGVLTVGMYKKPVKMNLGVIETDSESRITGYIEKPEKVYDVSMGIYVYEPEVLDYIEPDTYLDFPELVLKLISNGEKVVGFPFDGYWLDIGRHEDYDLAQEEFEKHRHIFLPNRQSGVKLTDVESTAF